MISIFAGTPEFAAVALRAMIARGHRPDLVLSQPDRPAGRGMKLMASPVKQVALAAGIEVFQPESLKDLAAQERLLAVAPDVMVVAAYGLILPQAVLDIPRHGCLNIHASLLPRWRGAAPIQRAIQAGDAATGVCIMAMEAGLDTGPVLARRETPIGETDTAASLHDRLATLGGDLLLETLDALADGVSPQARPQAQEGVTYAHKLAKGDALVDWTRPAAEVDRQIRAFNPVPGAFTGWGDGVLKLWNSRLVAADGQTGEPGTLLAVSAQEGVLVACGQGQVLVTEFQKAGGKRLGSVDFLAGTPLRPGDRFHPPGL